MPVIAAQAFAALVTLVTGVSASTREGAIRLSILAEEHSAMYEPSVIALILEGLPDGKSDQEWPHPTMQIKRIAPGCLCCIGLLTLRVTLNRLLRNHSRRLYISIADFTHLENIRTILGSPPYDEWLLLSPDIAA